MGRKTLSELTNIVRTSDMSEKERAELIIQIWGMKIKARHALFTLVGVIIAAIITAIPVIIVTIINNPSPISLEQPNVSGINNDNIPISFEEDYKELQKLYDNCLNSYNRFQDKHDDFQNSYLALVNSYNDCLNAYNNAQSIEFVNNSSEFIKKYNDFAEREVTFAGENSIFKSSCENYSGKYGAFKKKYVYDFLDENGNVIPSYELTEERQLIANVFLSLSDMTADLLHKIDDNWEKSIDVRNKTDDLNDKIQDIEGKVQNLSEMLQGFSDFLEGTPPTE